MTRVSITIRPAEAGDVAHLVDLRGHLLDVASAASYASRSAAEREAWKASYASWVGEVHGTDDRVRIIVGEVEGEIVGCATGIVDRRPPAPDCISGWCGWVQSVVVAPSWRRQGVAGQLMHALMDWFAERSASKVVLEATHDAEQFYDKLGFVRSPEGLFTNGGARP